MGFPFDRTSDSLDLKSFLTENMQIQDVKIVHEDGTGKFPDDPQNSSRPRASTGTGGL